MEIAGGGRNSLDVLCVAKVQILLLAGGCDALGGVIIVNGLYVFDHDENAAGEDEEESDDAQCAEGVKTDEYICVICISMDDEIWRYTTHSHEEEASSINEFSSLEMNKIY